MRIAAPLLGLLLLSASVAAEPSSETLRYAIVRNGDQIGTHTVEFKRNGQEITVNTETDVLVKVLFVTAYRFQYSASERWVSGRLVALDSATDDNGTRHQVTVALKASALDVQADGRATQVDKSTIPDSLWNPEVTRRVSLLNSQDGQVLPISVVDQGTEQLTVGGQLVTAHRYTIKGKFSQDVWYDGRGRLVQVQLVGPDGSVISYRLV